MSCLIRPADADDFTYLQAFNQGLFLYEKQFGETYDEWWMYGEKGVEYFMKRMINEDGRAILLMAEVEGEAVGYLAGYVGDYSYRNVNPIAELENMFVVEEFRSRGVGGALMEGFLKAARSLGAVHARVGAHAKNDPTIRFYRSKGFDDHELFLERSVS